MFHHGSFHFVIEHLKSFIRNAAHAAKGLYIYLRINFKQNKNNVKIKIVKKYYNKKWSPNSCSVATDIILSPTHNIINIKLLKK